MLRLAKVPRQLNGRGRMPSKPFPFCHSASLPGRQRLSCLFSPRGPLGRVHLASVHLALDSQKSGCVLRKKRVKAICSLWFGWLVGWLSVDYVCVGTYIMARGQLTRLGSLPPLCRSQRIELESLGFGLSTRNRHSILPAPDLDL